jgi:hypothetical protein
MYRVAYFAKCKNITNKAKIQASENWKKVNIPRDKMEKGRRGP